MVRADKTFFINFRNEIVGEKVQESSTKLMAIGCFYTPDSISSGSLIRSPSIPTESEKARDEAYDELCRQNVDLSNEISVLKKENHELQNKLDAIQSTNQGESENVISFEAFVRCIEESFDDVEVKAAKNLGTLFFDGEAKKRIYNAANKRLAEIKASTNIEINGKVGQVAERITNKLE